MKTALVLLLIGLGSFAQAAGIYEDKNTCVIVYVKTEIQQPNLTISCDGERMLSHVIRPEKEMDNAEQFKEDLFLAFVGMTNEEGNKKCQQYDYENIWYAVCSRPQ